MRLSISLLLTSSSIVDASWVKLPGHRDLLGRRPFAPARETGRFTADGSNGRTPKPTQALGFLSASDAALELLREKRDGENSNSWEDVTTCGWTAGVSSRPFTCAPGYSCRTSDANVVACVSGTYSPFFTVCLDMQAFEHGACASIGPQTGCCESSAFGACGTFLWTGNPPRSMYRCFSEPIFIYMDDEPQAALDTSASTTSTSTTSTSSSTASSSTTSSSPAQTTTPDADTDKPSSNSTDIGAIVGGTVGGVAALALTACLAAWLVLRHGRAGRREQSYNTLPSDFSRPHSVVTAHTAQQYPGGYENAAAAIPLTSHYETTAPTAAYYDPRQSYYDPGQASNTGYAAQPHPHYSTASEMDTAPLSGSHENPAEIGGRTA